MTQSPRKTRRALSLAVVSALSLSLLAFAAPGAQAAAGSTA